MNIRKFNLNKLICFIIICISCLSFISCNDNDKKTDIIPNTEYTVFPDEMKGIIKNKNIYVTSIGQDAEMTKFEISTLEKQSEFTYTIDPFLKANTVEEESVLFAFVGCSIKALSDSGTTLDDEIKRANEFINLGKEKFITLIVVHAGGPARRGSTSDSLIELMFSNSDFNIFVESGNFDGFLTDTAKANNVKTYMIQNSLSLKDVVDKLYGE